MPVRYRILLVLVLVSLPHLLAASATGAMVSLMLARFTLGMAQAPMFPVSASAIANWFPVGRWGWVPTIASGSVFAVLGAVLWSMVRLQRAPCAIRS